MNYWSIDFVLRLDADAVQYEIRAQEEVRRSNGAALYQPVPPNCPLIFSPPKVAFESVRMQILGDGSPEKSMRKHYEDSPQ